LPGLLAQKKTNDSKLNTNFSKKSEKDRPAKYDFRKTSWGMTRAQVKKQEAKKPLAENNKYIKYQTKLDYMRCLLYYFFEKDRLIRTYYEFKVFNGNEELWYFLVPLFHKYGSPLSVKRKFNPASHYNREYYYFRAQWTTKNTIIEITLFEKLRLYLKYFAKQKYKWRLPKKKRKPDIAPEDI
jgi:hypothetical protein